MFLKGYPLEAKTAPKKSYLEFRFQIIVSSIKLRKGFSKFMIQIALLKKFLS